MHRPTSKPPVLRVRGAVKRFGKTPALDEVSFELRPGEWVGLIGANGAGKTTLLRALASLLSLDSGEIELSDHRRDGHGPIGFVPQEIALYDAMSVEENLSVFGTLHGLPRRRCRERVAWALGWIGLDGRRSDRVERLSGGMKRRLNIACGVLHEPRVVLLDEPTVGLDPEARERIWRMLGELRDAGASLLQSSHHIEEIESVCDRVMIFDGGRIIASGTVDQLLEQVGNRASAFELTLDRPWRGSSLRAPFEARGTTLRGALEDIDDELPALLAEIRQAGHRVRGVNVRRPNLGELFDRIGRNGGAR